MTKHEAVVHISAEGQITFLGDLTDPAYLEKVLASIVSIISRTVPPISEVDHLLMDAEQP